MSLTRQGQCASMSSKLQTTVRLGLGGKHIGSIRWRVVQLTDIGEHDHVGIEFGGTKEEEYEGIRKIKALLERCLVSFKKQDS